MLLDSTCIHSFVNPAMSFDLSDETGVAVMDDGTRSIYPQFMSLETDAHIFGRLKQWEKEFALPHSMQICHTIDRIYGVQLVLGHHREKFEGEDDLIERYGQKLYFQSIDENIAKSAPMRMNFIGNDGGQEGAKCDWVYFFDKGQFSQLDEIVAYTDSYGVKGLELTVLHNEGIEAEYEDLQFGARPSDELKATTFTFQ